MIGQLVLQATGSEEKRDAVLQILTSTRNRETSEPEESLAMAIDRYLNSGFESPDTYATYSRTLTRLKNAYGDLPLREVTGAMIHRFLFRRKRGGELMATNTVKTYRAALSAFWRWLTDQGYKGVNPVASVKKIKSKKGTPVALRPSEQARLIELASKSSRLGLRNLAMAVLFLWAGPRASEIGRLKWNDIDFEEKLVTIMGKGKKERIIPLFPPAAEALMRFKESLGTVREDACIFVNSQGTARGKPMNRDGIEKLFRVFFRPLGISKGISVHCLRHTFAVNLAMRGAKPQFIQYALGHVSLETTMIYQRFYGKDAIDELNRCYHSREGSTESPRNAWDEALQKIEWVLETDKEE